MFITGIGHDSHRFVESGDTKPLVLGGVTIDGAPGLSGNSDADVVLHTITNAISSITGVNVLGAIADKMCAAGATDSTAYLKEAMRYLHAHTIHHVAITLEMLRPKLAPHVESIRQNVAGILGILPHQVCCQATTGEGLTAFGKGEGIQAFVVVTAVETELYNKLQNLLHSE